MKLIEINTKFFFAEGKTFAIIESYANPAEELEIDFVQSQHNHSTYYGRVYEKTTRIPVVEVMFTLRADIIDIGNIIPADHPTHDKLVHTSLGTQYNGVDMGGTAVRWLFRKLKEYAKSKGFDIRKIVSDTRYTGARAKNNPGSDDLGMPKSFSVSASVKESICYDCASDQFLIKTDSNENN